MSELNKNETVVRSSEILTEIRAYLLHAEKNVSDARDLLRDMESIINEQEEEWERLNGTQINPIANFLLRNGFAPVAHEEYCETALRVLRELTGKN